MPPFASAPPGEKLFAGPVWGVSWAERGQISCMDAAAFRWFISNRLLAVVTDRSQHPGMIDEVPRQNYRILRKLIPKRLQPLARGLRKGFLDPSRPREEPYRTVFPYTQTHPLR